ncbi:Sprr1a [Symbiodinium sp. CCMP2592]|nr:Sprr1a [Symbiodinium sp. CCMP2592]
MAHFRRSQAVNVVLSPALPDLARVGVRLGLGDYPACCDRLLELLDPKLCSETDRIGVQQANAELQRLRNKLDLLPESELSKALQEAQGAPSNAERLFVTLPSQSASAKSRSVLQGRGLGRGSSAPKASLDKFMKQMRNTTEVAEPSEPVVAQPSESVAEPSEPAVAEPSEPVVAQPSEPVVAQPSEPAVAEPSEPVAEPSEPKVAEPSEPVAEPSEPVAESSEPEVAQPSEPAVAESSEPEVAQPSEPVAQPSEPKVAEPSEPKVAEPSEAVVAEPSEAVVAQCSESAEQESAEEPSIPAFENGKLGEPLKEYRDHVVARQEFEHYGPDCPLEVVRRFRECLYRDEKDTANFNPYWVVLEFPTRTGVGPLPEWNGAMAFCLREGDPTNFLLVSKNKGVAVRAENVFKVNGEEGLPAGWQRGNIRIFDKGAYYQAKDQDAAEFSPRAALRSLEHLDPVGYMSHMAKLEDRFGGDTALRTRKRKATTEDEYIYVQREALNKLRKAVDEEKEAKAMLAKSTLSIADFNYETCQCWYWDEPSGCKKSVPLDEAVATAIQTRRTIVLYGPPGRGKSPFAKALAGWYMQHVLRGKIDEMIFTGTVDSLRKAHQFNLLQDGRPLVFDDLLANRQNVGSQGGGPDFVKQLLGISRDDRATLQSRYADMQIPQDCLRIITVQDVDKVHPGLQAMHSATETHIPKEFCGDLHDMPIKEYFDVDRRAILKRMVAIFVPDGILKGEVLGGRVESDQENIARLRELWSKTVG